MHAKKLVAGVLCSAAVLPGWWYALQIRDVTLSLYHVDSREDQQDQAAVIPAYPWANDPFLASRANDSMCPYLEWAGWHSSEKPEQHGFVAPAVVPALVRETPVPHKDCPLVYVYRNLPESWTLLDVHQLTAAKVFGQGALQSLGLKSKTHPAIRPVSQHDGILALYTRLMQNTRCYTEDPEQADLFFVPIYVSAPLRKESWLMSSVKAKCEGKADELIAALPHLTWETAHRHVIGMGRMSIFWFLDTCLPGVDVGGPEAMTSAQALLRAVPLIGDERLWPATMRTEFIEVHLTRRSDARWCCQGTRCNNVHAMPYIPSLTWNTALQNASEANASAVNHTWVPANHERDIFLLYITSDSLHGDVDVRKRLQKVSCADNSSQVPGYKVAFQCYFDWSAGMAAIKLRARYCLEAAGDTVGRKSIADDYAAGCIPVFIGDAMSVPYPEFWRGWHQDAFIILNRKLYLHRRIDLVQALQEVSEAKRLRIERNMATYGQRFMWFEEDVKGVDDAFDVVLRGCWRHSLELGRRKDFCPKDAIIP